VMRTRNPSRSPRFSARRTGCDAKPACFAAATRRSRST
jgi:hypothetical protein